MNDVIDIDLSIKRIKQNQVISYNTKIEIILLAFKKKYLFKSTK